MNENYYMDADDAATYAEMTETDVLYLLLEKKISYVLDETNEVLVSRDELEAFLVSQEVAA